MHSQVKICKNKPYGSASYRLEEEGSVNIKVNLSKDAEVTDLLILKSSGYKRIDEATKLLLKDNCQYSKLSMGDNLLPYYIIFIYTWNLNEPNNLRVVDFNLIKN